jgi:hypothetical protein
MSGNMAMTTVPLPSSLLANSLDEQLEEAAQFLDAVESHHSAIKSIQAQLSVAVAANDVPAGHRLGKQLQIAQLKTQLSAAVAAGDSAAVSNLGGELANLETEPAEPEAEPVPNTLPMAHSVAQVEPARYEPNDYDEMGEDLRWLDEPHLQLPSVSMVAHSCDPLQCCIAVQWQLTSVDQGSAGRLPARISTSRFRVAYKLSSWWMWEYLECELGVTADCGMVPESDDGTCELIIHQISEAGKVGQAACSSTPACEHSACAEYCAHPGHYAIQVAPLYLFNGDWSVREWSEEAELQLTEADEKSLAATPVQGWASGLDSWCSVQ